MMPWWLVAPSVESGDQPTDLGSALLSSRMVGVYRA